MNKNQLESPVLLFNIKYLTKSMYVACGSCAKPHLVNVGYLVEKNNEPIYTLHSTS